MEDEKVLVEPGIQEPDLAEQYIAKRLTKIQLSELRKAKHITQKELSEISGLSIKCISDIENENGGNPTLKSILKYLDCLGYEMIFQRRL